MSYPKARAYRRSSAGVVHRLLYSRLNRVWYISCRSPGDPGTDRGAVVGNAAVTCKRCGR